MEGGPLGLFHLSQNILVGNGGHLNQNQDTSSLQRADEPRPPSARDRRLLRRGSQLVPSVLPIARRPPAPSLPRTGPGPRSLWESGDALVPEDGDTATAF